MPRSHNKHRPVRRDRGFTLIEVLTVAAIIAILSTMAVVSMRGGRRVAYETRAVAAMKNIAESELMYYQRYRFYGNWNQMVAEGDLIDPGYVPNDDLAVPTDAPIANLYSIAIYLPPMSQAFSAVAFPKQNSIWHLRTYAVTSDGSIVNSHDHPEFFSLLPLELFL